MLGAEQADAGLQVVGYLGFAGVVAAIAVPWVLWSKVRRRAERAERSAAAMREEIVQLRPGAASGDSAYGAGTAPRQWGADPTGRHLWRWWEGTRWTEFVSDGGAPVLDALAGLSG